LCNQEWVVGQEGGETTTQGAEKRRLVVFQPRSGVPTRRRQATRVLVAQQPQAAATPVRTQLCEWLHAQSVYVKSRYLWLAVSTQRPIVWRQRTHGKLPQTEPMAIAARCTTLVLHRTASSMAAPHPTTDAASDATHPAVEPPPPRPRQSATLQRARPTRAGARATHPARAAAADGADRVGGGHATRRVEHTGHLWASPMSATVCASTGGTRRQAGGSCQGRTVGGGCGHGRSRGGLVRDGSRAFVHCVGGRPKRRGSRSVSAVPMVPCHVHVRT